jgi:molybdate transport repressor ModE-like protein
MLDQGGGAIDWDDFRFVLAIVRGGSVSAAAKQLGVDHATVIRRVDRLEHHLSAKLFDRRKTGYLLTEAGQRVADSAEAMESTIVANQEAVGGSRAHLTGTVRIGAPDGFGSHFLASRLVKFTERYPDLDLQLVATARLFSLSKREADIAISLSMPKEGRIVGRKLLDYNLGLYAVPAYLDRAPEIASRSDLPAPLRRLHRGTAVHAGIGLSAAGLAKDFRQIPQRQSDCAAQRDHRRFWHRGAAAFHGDRASGAAPGALR